MSGEVAIFAPAPGEPGDPLVRTRWMAARTLERLATDWARGLFLETTAHQLVARLVYREREMPPAK